MPFLFWNGRVAGSYQDFLQLLGHSFNVLCPLEGCLSECLFLLHDNSLKHLPVGDPRIVPTLLKPRQGTSFIENQTRLQYPVVAGGSVLVNSPFFHERYYLRTRQSCLECVSLSRFVKDVKTVLCDNGFQGFASVVSTPAAPQRRFGIGVYADNGFLAS